MPITDQRYVPDAGRVIVNSLTASGSVKTVSVSPPRRAIREIHTLGGSASEAQTRAKAGDYEVTLEILDDQSLANDDTGLLGILWDAYYTNTAIATLDIVPAGSTPGMSEYSYTTVEVVQCPPHAAMDADTEDEGTVSVILTCAGVSSAAIV